MSARARAVLALFALSLFGALATGRDLLYHLTYLWAGLFMLSFLWSRVALRRLQFKREPRSLRAQVGQLFVERFSLENRDRLPKLWVEVRDGTNLPGYRAMTLKAGLRSRGAFRQRRERASNVMTLIRSGDSRYWMVRTLCTRRGRFRLGPAHLVSGDPFGLFPVTAELPAEQHVVVLPMTFPLHAFPVPSGRLPGGDALRQRTHQVTPHAAGVRDYAPGDGMNRIHWPSTARRRRLIVKEFEFDPLAEMWIVLDSSRKAQYESDVVPEEASGFLGIPERPELPPASGEYAISAAASIAMHFLEQERAVGLVTFGHSRHIIQPERGTSQLLRILETLAVLDQVGAHPLTEVLTIVRSRLPQGATVILITANLDEALIASLRRLEYNQRKTVLVVLDPLSFGGPPLSEGILAAAEQVGATVLLVKNGQDLSAALHAGRSWFRPIAG